MFCVWRRLGLRECKISLLFQYTVKRSLLFYSRWLSWTHPPDPQLTFSSPTSIRHCPQIYLCQTLAFKKKKMQQNFIHNQPRTHFCLLPYYSANWTVFVFIIYSALLYACVILPWTSVLITSYGIPFTPDRSVKFNSLWDRLLPFPFVSFVSEFWWHLILLWYLLMSVLQYK